MGGSGTKSTIRAAQEEVIKGVREADRLHQEFEDCVKESVRLQNAAQDDRDPWFKLNTMNTRVTEKKLSKMSEKRTHDTNILAGNKRIQEKAHDLRRRMGHQMDVLREFCNCTADDVKAEDGRPLCVVVEERVALLSADLKLIDELKLLQRINHHEALKGEDSQYVELKEWAQRCMTALSDQATQMETDMLNSSPDQQMAVRETLSRKIERHRWHIERLDSLLRAMNQHKVLRHDALQDVQDRVDEYVHNAAASDMGTFFHEYYDDDMYEELELELPRGVDDAEMPEEHGAVDHAAPASRFAARPPAHSSSSGAISLDAGSSCAKTAPASPAEQRSRQAPAPSGASARAARLNSKGYPLRPGVDPCPYFLKTGKCWVCLRVGTRRF